MKLFSRIALFSLWVTLLTPVHAEYVAYSVDDGERRPLPEFIDDIEAVDLLNVEWGGYGGRKARVGVLEVDNNSGSGSFVVTSALGTTINYSSAETGVPVNGIEAIVVDVLNRTGRYRMVEREGKALQSVINEQDMGDGGRIAKPSAAKIGNILGAEYLVQVVVTSYEPGTSGKDIGVGGIARKVPLLGGVKLKNRKGQVGMNFRLIDAETSEILFTKQIESVIKESGLAFGGAGWSSAAVLGGFMSNYSKTPIGQAVIAGINEGVYELVKQIGSASAQGSVVKADAREVFVNLGADSVESGEVMKVMQKGEE
ncbi:MAG: CsgG/HfaB family protein, partial [Pseudomonadota bacterium]